MKTYLISITLLLAFSACGHKNADEKQSAADVMLLPAPPPSIGRAEKANMIVTLEDKKASDRKEVTDTSKKIIKDGDIRFQAIDLKLTKVKIVSSLNSLGGYVADENETNNGTDNQREFTLKVRIPSKNFDKFLEALSGDADRIDTKNIRIRDITTEYIDVTTQIKNKKILESRYQALMAKATKMADLLEIEDKLTEIRTDIESTQGQLNYLNSQVAYSTLDITFYSKQNGQVNKGNEFGYKFKTAVTDGWDVLQNIFYALIALWPILIITALVLWAFKRWIRKRKARKAE